MRIHQRRIIIQYNILLHLDNIAGSLTDNMISLSHLTMRLAGGGHQITILDERHTGDS